MGSLNVPRSLHLLHSPAEGPKEDLTCSPVRVGKATCQVDISLRFVLD